MEELLGGLRFEKMRVATLNIVFSVMRHFYVTEETIHE
jgi:hypothetical protein